ncbi:hypothetical protein Tco_1575509 [Tanacetum coccineum]
MSKKAGGYRKRGCTEYRPPCSEISTCRPPSKSYGRSLLPVKQGSGLYYGQTECKRYRELNFNLKVKGMPNRKRKDTKRKLNSDSIKENYTMLDPENHRMNTTIPKAKYVTCYMVPSSFLRICSYADEERLLSTPLCGLREWRYPK